MQAFIMFMAGLVLANAQDDRQGCMQQIEACNQGMQQAQAMLPPQGGSPPNAETLKAYCGALPAAKSCFTKLMEKCAVIQSILQPTIQSFDQMAMMCPGSSAGGEGMGGAGGGKCNVLACMMALGGEDEATSEVTCPKIPKAIECLNKAKADCPDDQGVQQQVLGMMGQVNEKKTELCAEYKTGGQEEGSNKSGSETAEGGQAEVTDNDEGKDGAAVAQASALLLSVASVLVMTLF